jgi:alpha-galactosidase
MNRHTAVVRHPAAGRVKPVRLFVRHRTCTPAPAGSAPPEARLDQGWLAPGTQQIGPFRLRVACDAQGECATYELSVCNAASEPLRLDALGLGFDWRGPAPRALRFLRQGWQSWSFAGARELDERGEPPFPSGPWLRGFHHVLGRVPQDRAGWHESDLATAVGVSPRGPACAVGVLETGLALGVIFLRREASSVRIEVEQWHEVPLEPDQEISGEAVRIALGTDAARLLEELAEEHGRRAGARSEAPFRTGWCSWYHFFHDVSEESFRRNLEALAANREDIPIEVVQLDDGYQRAIGDWLETNPRFPRGLAPLAAEVRAAGFVPGIWLAPFCVVPESRVFGLHRDWLLRRDDDLLRGLHHAAWTREGWVYVLDPSREEVCTHLAGVAGGLTSLGFEYLKLDFLYTAALEAQAHDARLSRAVRLRRGLEAVRAGAGQHAFLLGCGCPLGPAVGVVDAMRIGPDTAPHWEPAPGARIPGLEPTVPAAENALRNVLARSWMNRRLWLNDPDCLVARDQDTALSPGEVRCLAAVIGVTGGLAVVSDDVPRLSPERRALVRETLELARRVDEASPGRRARTLDLLEGEVACGVVAGIRDATLVALVNAGSERAVRAVEPAAHGVPPGGAEPEPLLGSSKPIEWAEGRLVAEVPAHEGVAYRLAGGPRLAVFCDFDGTFAVQDVGSTLARRYAAERREALWARLTRGELTAWEYNVALLDGLRLPEEDLEAFLRSVALDPGARDLLVWCEQHGIPFRVLSDGFDRNLDRLQELNDVRFVYDANHLRYEDGAWRIEAGQPNPDCPCGTGTCKRGRIEAFRARHRGVRIVHVGNGRVSDLCGALAADVVFAKDSLAEALEERGIRFERFRTLHDVRAGLERLLDRLG